MAVRVRTNPNIKDSKVLPSLMGPSTCNKQNVGLYSKQGTKIPGGENPDVSVDEFVYNFI